MRILMLIDSLDIGGAETHVEILCRELVNLGHKIVIASAGGVICERLKKCGIRCISLPKITKANKISCNFNFVCHFLALAPLISRAIERTKPDIVHAHTRRTAFFAQNPCKKHNIPLVVTAHAKFDMKFPKNVLSKWGQRTIAVSKDIKDHLAEHGVPQNTIKVIVNGVILPGNVLYSTENTIKEGEVQCKK